jgi:hypothetical protein
MKSKMLSKLALVIGLFAAAAASAALQTIAGTVVAKDAANNTVTVETDTGDRLLFKTIPTTLMKTRDGTVIAVDGLGVGDRVEVSAEATATPATATQLIVLVPVSGGIVTAPGVDRVNNQTDNTGKASGYRPSQQVPADAD